MMSSLRSVTSGSLLALVIATGPVGAASAHPSTRLQGDSALTSAGHPSATAQSTATVTVPQRVVTAVVVKSWNKCNPGRMWGRLNADWQSLGSVPISIDSSDPTLCGTSLTLARLEASGADVVILDDCAGGLNQFTPAEVDALQTYANEGHNLVGTYETFAYATVDNSALAPLFGLVQNDGWADNDNTPTYTFGHASFAKPLARDLPTPYNSRGLASSQEPAAGSWSANDLDGAAFAAMNADHTAAITVYRAAGYDAVYISNMPEYHGHVQDRQFMYNAIIYPRKG